MTDRATRLTGYACALGAGAIWGTTGPLSTLLYAQGAAITGIGFWRLAIGILGLLAFGLFRPDLFRADVRGWLLVGLGGGVLVALFELAYQYAISGAGVAGAAALLYTAPVLVAILAVPLLGERLTPLRGYRASHPANGSKRRSPLNRAALRPREIHSSRRA